MKKMEYKTPVLEVRGFAQFENVFTYCSKGNAGRGCNYIAPGEPGQQDQPDLYAAYGTQSGSPGSGTV